MPEWNAEQYLKFRQERTLPSHDLIAHAEPEEVHIAIDLGCGPGNSTKVVKEKYPQAKVIGVDSSQDMIRKAQQADLEGDYRIGVLPYCLQELPKADLLFSNACLQWVPDHETLLPKIMEGLNPGGVFAAQIPIQSAQPIHRILKEVSMRERWKDLVTDLRVFHNLTESDYFDILSDCSADFRIWTVTYFHRMPDAESILDWFRGTAVLPYTEQVQEEEREDFLQDVLAELRKEYPVQKNGEVILRFPRLFWTAQKG